MNKLLLSFCVIAAVGCGKKETSSVGNYNNSTVATQPSAQPEPAPAETAVKGDENLPGYALINGSDCSSCHKSEGKLIGPAFAEIAAKYSEADTNILAEKIVSGGSGVWGDVAMAPHPNIAKEDAKKMVAYILSMRSK